MERELRQRMLALVGELDKRHTRRSSGAQGDAPWLLVSLYLLVLRYLRLFEEAMAQPALRVVLDRVVEALVDDLGHRREPELNPLDLNEHYRRGFTELVKVSSDQADRRMDAIVALAAIRAIDKTIYSSPVSGRVWDSAFCSLVRPSLEDDARYWVWRRRPDFKPPWLPTCSTHQREAARVHNLAAHAWLQNTRILPMIHGGVRIRPVTLAGKAVVALEGAHPRVAVWPISKHLHRRLHWPTVGTYIAEEWDGQKQKLVEVLEREGEGVDDLIEVFQDRILPACAKEDVSVLLLPELSVGTRLLDGVRVALSRWSEKRSASELPPRPVLVVAGSQHVRVGNEPGSHVNRCQVLNFDGSDAIVEGLDPHEHSASPWRHDKIARFAENDLVEPARLGEQAMVVETPIGRICTPICIDYLRHVGMWRDPVQRAWVDWFLVPAATPRTGRFENLAALWAYDDATTVVANTCWKPQLAGEGAWSDAFAVYAKAPRDEMRLRSAGPLGEVRPWRASMNEHGAPPAAWRWDGTGKCPPGCEVGGCAEPCETGCLWIFG